MLKFDKFIKDIIKRENQQREKMENYVKDQEELPQRIYNKLYRELPQNRIRYTKKKK